MPLTRSERGPLKPFMRERTTSSLKKVAKEMARLEKALDEIDGISVSDDALPEGDGLAGTAWCGDIKKGFFFFKQTIQPLLGNLASVIQA